MTEINQEVKVFIRAMVTFGERLLLVSDDNKNWHLPGKELILGEEMTLTAEKAVEHETGLLVRAGRLFSVHENIENENHVVEFLFLCRFKDEEPDEMSTMKKNIGYFTVDDINNNQNIIPCYLSFGQWTTKKRNTSRAIYQGSIK